MINEIERDFFSNFFNERTNDSNFSNPEYIYEPISENSSMISHNKNKILVSRSSFLARPHPERPFEGSLQIFVDSLHTIETDSNFPYGNTFMSQISSSIEKSFRQSKFLDLESLLVKPCELSWNIRIDIHILEFNSFILDACSFAILHSVSNIKIPVTCISESSPIIYSSMERTPKNVNFFFYPYIFTFPHTTSKNAGYHPLCQLLLGLSNTFDILSVFQITESTYPKEIIHNALEIYREKLIKILSLLRVCK